MSSKYSALKLTTQFQVSFFYEKISRAQKHSQSNTNQQTELRKQKTTKATVFCAHKLRG